MLYGEEVLVREVLSLAHSQLPTLTDAFLEALEHQTLEEAIEAAHTLRGVCANANLSPLAELVWQMEGWLRAGQADLVDAMMARLIREYQETMAALHAWTVGSTPKPGLADRP